MRKLKKITAVIVLVAIMLTYIQTLVFAAESELTLTPKPETNNIHLKWTGPQNSSYKVYQKKPGSNNFETIGLLTLVILMKKLKYLIYIRCLQQYTIHPMYT